jgi:hypothetical protein
MASLNDATDRRPTPPLSPSTSSSNASSASSSSSSPLSLILQREREGTNLRATRPGSLPLKRRDPISKPGLVTVTDSIEGDTMMLDDWGEVGHERLERLHGKQFPARTPNFYSILAPPRVIELTRPLGGGEKGTN